MADFNPGAVIERGSPLWPADQVRPDWLRDDARVMMRGSVTGWWYGDPDCTNVTFFGEEVNGGADDAIRLDASDIVYRCVAHNSAHPDEPPMWPWYGGELPSDLDERGHMLFGDGTTGLAIDMARLSRSHCIVGYQRRPTPGHPEPVEEWEGELTAEEQAMIDAAWEKHKAAGPCDRPPAGWKCSRGYGHSGPCAAVRRPATSHPEPAQRIPTAASPAVPSPFEVGRASVAAAVDREIRSKHGIDPGVPAYSAVETAQHYPREAGGVLVPWMMESEADEWLSSVGCNAWEALEALKRLGIIRPDPTPLDIARAEFPDADPAMIERIVQIAKGEAK